jgi:hypothetical protein
MRTAILAVVVAASAITGAATSASAQSVYFGVGGGGYRHHYYEGYRPYYRHRAYAYGERCYVRTVRHFNRYRGVWVARRIRTCN